MITSEDLYAEDVDEDLDQGPLEDAEAEEAPDNIETEDQENETKEVVKPKRVVRNPQPKLNAQTLKGTRGLTALESYFDRVKFKGKGYEETDLSVILKTYEYWCHRLFPKYPFDECIAKIEKLGAKKEVQTHIKRIRLDMIFDQEPNLLDDEDSDDGRNQGNIVNDQFNELLNIPQAQSSNELTDEQEQQIRINRARAEKLRKEKNKINLDTSTLPLMETNEISVSQRSTQGDLLISEMDDLPVSQNLTEDSEIRSQEKHEQIVGLTSEIQSSTTRDDNYSVSTSDLLASETISE